MSQMVLSCCTITYYLGQGKFTAFLSQKMVIHEYKNVLGHQIAEIDVIVAQKGSASVLK